MEVGPDQADRLCNIILSDVTEPRPTGYRLSMLLASVDSLRLMKMYSAYDVWTILRGCSDIQQFAKVTHQEERDGSALKTLTNYMSRHGVVSDSSAVCHTCSLLAVFILVVAS